MSRPFSWFARLASRGPSWLSLAALVGAGWVFWASAELPPPAGDAQAGGRLATASGPAAAASAAGGTSPGR